MKNQDLLEVFLTEGKMGKKTGSTYNQLVTVTSLVYLFYEGFGVIKKYLRQGYKK